MRKLILIDDEDIIREGLERTIDWAQWGFAVAATASDGEEGLIAIERHRPDLVITDIRMPRMDGLTLLEQVKRRFPAMPVLLLSGYEEFTYAQRGMNLGASGYLTKLDITKELPGAMRRILMQLDEQAAARHRPRMRVTPEMAPLVAAAFRLGGADGAGGVDEAGGAQASGRAQASGGVDASGGAQSDAGAGWRGRVLAAFDGAWFTQEEDAGGLLIVPRADLQTVVAGLQTLMPPEGMRAHWLVSDPMPDDTSLFGAQAVLRAWQPYLSRDTPLRVDTLGAFTMTFARDAALAPLERQMLDAADRLDIDAMEAAFRRWCGKLLQSTMPFPLIREEAIAVLGMLTYHVQRAVAPQSDAALAIQPLLAAADPDHLACVLDAQMALLTERLQAQPLTVRRRYVSQVTAFVQAHLDARITLQDVAGVLFISPNYLSTIFRQETGQTFSDYVIASKMQHAASLLLRGSSIGEAARQVGYADVGHFREMYRKFIGRSPKRGGEGDGGGK